MMTLLRRLVVAWETIAALSQAEAERRQVLDHEARAREQREIAMAEAHEATMRQLAENQRQLIEEANIYRQQASDWQARWNTALNAHIRECQALHGTVAPDPSPDVVN